MQFSSSHLRICNTGNRGFEGLKILFLRVRGSSVCEVVEFANPLYAQYSMRFHKKPTEDHQDQSFYSLKAI